MIQLVIDWMERRRLPDFAIRWGIRRLLHGRLHDLHAAYDPDPAAYMTDFLQRLEVSSIAEDTDAANEQHYELPPAFFEFMLGPRRKYSSCYFDTPDVSLKNAEESMLELTAERAGLEDGMEVLELGCGWGSLSIWMAEKYPNSSITAVSNSRPQRDFIEQRSSEQGITNLKVVTRDMNEFEYHGKADRILSVEMFEHMRNYRVLFRRMNGWLKKDGALFVHIFTHQSIPYLFESGGKTDWMGTYFFSGGTMPSHGLFQICQDGFDIEQDWTVNGLHYSRTLEAWLNRLDTNSVPAMEILSGYYGDEAALWFQRWRIFLMACSELFAFHKGCEWQVSHYRMVPHG